MYSARSLLLKEGEPTPSESPTAELFKTASARLELLLGVILETTLFLSIMFPSHDQGAGVRSFRVTSPSDLIINVSDGEVVELKSVTLNSSGGVSSE